MRLESEHKVFIIQRLACYDGLTDVINAFAERYGERLASSQVAYYDPTNTQGGRELAKDWRDLFYETRRRYINDTSEIAIAHQTHRLRVLDENERKARKMGNLAMSNACLEQAAKEIGNVFTNKTESTVDVSGLTDTERANRAAALFDAARKRRTGQSAEA